MTALLRIERRPDAPADDAAWPDSVPAVAHLLAHGLEVPAGVTFLVGENGAGKSTIVEAVAEALGIPPDGGSTDHVGGAERGRASDRSDLGDRLRTVWHGRAGGHRGFFLRAETMHRFVSYLEDASAPADGPPSPHQLHRLSHGESFVEMLTGSWVRAAGVVLLDEPESALSFTTSLALLDVLAQLAATERHVLCATHSPILTALPGARVLQLDDAGITPVAWEELEVVRHWRAFLDAPGRYLRHLGD
ncbi:Predicted ATPase [Georgenia satyanarayanai]|uniref:Predicted ATPase n=1 Tax=Georgenia satyanarayanai TaxID=860221 RepID=A0A2Y9AS46_9MICO|nr:AAA family ATPase [Georgenia satyanarayanai]PYF97367.1 putative ATPase [Georgenia satyanarayanai]SSA46148.1 Predicted ATPase [Georgenia satyanarayanai]